MENKETFFELLKKHRESQSIKISDICEFTKINTRYIEAIETGDFKVLPTVYMRLFLRAYTKFIKADHIKALEDYEVYTTGKALDKSNFKSISNNDSSMLKNFSPSESIKIAQIPPQKILTIIIVLIGLTLALYWAGKVTGEQNIQSKDVSTNKLLPSYQSKQQEDAENKINSIISPNIDLQKISQSTNLDKNSESDEKTFSLKPNNYLIKNRLNELTAIIQTNAPYSISIKAINKTRLNISKSNGDSSKVLINGIIDKDKSLKFTFESIINFDFIDNSDVIVMINDIPIQKYLDSNGLAIRGSYRAEKSQLYIGFYKSN